MEELLEEEFKKDSLINKLLQLGIYKSKNRQLFELSVEELEEAYNLMNQTK